MESINVILLTLGTAIATNFAQWFFFRRKNTADAVAAEIANYKLIIDDWKKAAEDWRKNAEEYRGIMLEQRKEMDMMQIKIEKLEEDLKRATCKILKLEKAKE